ncbi:MAG TPA: hypothetical protein VFC60_03990 [Tissierellaceae bacterium]|nr:hypothetical protein [Tissierellaceae bacterium]
MLDTRITIKMIETAINKGIRDIEDNPKRGIRNLVDLAKHFANSPFQKDILHLMQTMLANLNSPYYHIVLDIINNVNHDTIKNFGINLGYKSWTYGAKKIRENQKKYGCSIPWTIIFDFSQEKKINFSIDNIANVIKQGKEIGIYTYMFFMNNINDLSCILRENLDCAFVLYIASDILTEENISEIKSYNNTVFSVLYEPSMNVDHFENAIQLLNKNKCLFGLHSYYGDENTNDILNDKWVDEIVEYKSSFGILIESESCSEENASLVQDYAFNSKFNQKHYAFLIDLYEDIARIDRNISKEACIFTVMGNGDTSSYNFSKEKEYNIKNMSLTNILSESY